LISEPAIVKKGYAIGSFIVYETDGLIQPGEDGPNALTPQQQKSVGGQKYIDQNKD
jgi:TonB-dependent starch-binding outer membrane protein SusC